MTILSFESERQLPYGRIVRAPDGTVSAIVEERDATDGAAGDPRAQLLDLRLRGRAALGGAREARPAQRPGRALPDRHDRPHRRGGRACGRLGLPRRAVDARDQHARRACRRRCRPARPDQRGAHARRRDDRRPGDAWIDVGVTLEPTPSSTRSRCCAARRRSPRAPRSARTRSPSTRRSARVRSSAHSVTFALAPFSRRGRRRGRSWRSRTRGSARGTKVPHLSYIGDADIGEDTNIAAGNVTANLSHEPGRPQGPDDDRQERQDRRRQYVRCSGHGWGRCLALPRERWSPTTSRRGRSSASRRGRSRRKDGSTSVGTRETMATTELATPAGARAP